MELTSEQKQQVAAWLEEGANLSEIQDRLGKEFDIRLTYMEARFLIDDLKLAFKEPAVEVPVEAVVEAPLDVVEPGAYPGEEAYSAPAAPVPPAVIGGVTVSVDSITRAGSMVSGGVSFSDGKKAAWYLDQTGRLGLTPDEPGYRPPEPDVAEFQLALEQQLAKLGI